MTSHPVPTSGFSNVYGGKRSLYYEDIPLWSQPYTFCSTTEDCVNVPDSPRCMGLQFPVSGNLNSCTCMCSAAIPSARLNLRRK